LSNGEISTELEDFIHAQINSIEQLEVLQLLYENRSRSWQTIEVAGRLYIQHESAISRLEDLESRGFCVRLTQPDLRYQYNPATADRDRLVRELIEAYRVRRVSIITLVFSKPADPIDSFSDAFRFRRNR